jgi:uncharacterized protein YbjT (DUF2867 family)
MQTTIRKLGKSLNAFSAHDAAASKRPANIPEMARRRENLIKASKIPYTILRSTQCFEFIDSIIKSGSEGDVVRLSPALVQPVAAEDVATTLADLAVGPPVNGIIEVAGPELFPLDKIARQVLAAGQDNHQVIADVHASYFGAALSDRSLTPGDHPRIGPIRLENWLSRSSARQ